ncbi:hypothetical protein ABT081_10755 [Streptomyces sp. NPDC002238]|uniref:hypothetical protein n=1 Tax=Streptomyces sp. NPDC002238 TaxID=3156649 RepID=UPI00332E44B5
MTESTPKWLADRQTRLGQVIRCSATGCPVGEWSSKAEERGWVRRGDGWLCVQCADAADERAEILARIDAGTWGPPATPETPVLTRRQQLLLATVHGPADGRYFLYVQPKESA